MAPDRPPLQTIHRTKTTTTLSAHGAQLSISCRVQETLPAAIAMALATTSSHALSCYLHPRRRRRGNVAVSPRSEGGGARRKEEVEIVIVGAGVAGLATAASLRRLAWAPPCLSRARCCAPGARR